MWMAGCIISDPPDFIGREVRRAVAGYGRCFMPVLWGHSLRHDGLSSKRMGRLMAMPRALSRWARQHFPMLSSGRVPLP